MYFLLFVGVLCLSLFCYALLFVHSSFVIILMRKRELITLLCIVFWMSCYCKCSVALLHSAVDGLQCVIVVFPVHNHVF